MEKELSEEIVEIKKEKRRLNDLLTIREQESERSKIATKEQETKIQELE